MGFDLLDTPLRLTWDVSADTTCQPPEDFLAVAERLAAAGVFYVTMEGEPLLRDDLSPVLDCLHSAGVQILSACHGRAAELLALANLPASQLRVLLHVTDFLAPSEGVDQAALNEAVASLRGQGREPTLVMTPLRWNVHLIPDLMRFCRDHEITSFKLPNADIGDSFRKYPEADLLRWNDLETFRKLWAELSSDFGDLPAMEIHDLFLWEILAAQETQSRSEYGGCQAANSLAHVDRQGQVHPCAAWPGPLGSLLRDSLDDIWHSSPRYAVREQIALQPPGCSACRDWALCHGGCRGLAKHLNRHNGGRDLMCRCPRD